MPPPNLQGAECHGPLVRGEPAAQSTCVVRCHKAAHRDWSLGGVPWQTGECLPTCMVPQSGGAPTGICNAFAETTHLLIARGHSFCPCSMLVWPTSMWPPASLKLESPGVGHNPLHWILWAYIKQLCNRERLSVKRRSSLARECCRLGRGPQQPVAGATGVMK